MDAYSSGGKHPVSRSVVSGDLKASIKSVVDKLGGLEKIISEGDSVILKPNFSASALYPASSDPAFVCAVAELCRDAGASEVKVLESAGLPWLPTEKVFNATGMTRTAKACGLELVPLDDTDVMEVEIKNGKEVQMAMMYAAAFEEGAKLIWLPCMKTDSYARFSLSLKLIEGLLDVRKKQWLGSEAETHEAKIAELNSAIEPHLIIMDARKAFSSGGPARGKVIQPNFILASGDRIAIDVTALTILASYPDDNLLTKKPWEYTQIKRAVELGLGAKSGKEIVLV